MQKAINLTRNEIIMLYTSLNRKLDTYYNNIEHNEFILCVHNKKDKKMIKELKKSIEIFKNCVKEAKKLMDKLRKFELTFNK